MFSTSQRRPGTARKRPTVAFASRLLSLLLLSLIFLSGLPPGTSAAFASPRHAFDSPAFVESAPATPPEIGLRLTNFIYRNSGESPSLSHGLYYLRARYLNAANGRFWNADSYEGENADPQSLHKYFYANADSVNRMDPSGQFTIAEVMTSTAISTDIRKDKDKQAVQQYRRAQQNNKQFTVYFGLKKGLGSSFLGRLGEPIGHAFIYVHKDDSSFGATYDVNPLKSEFGRLADATGFGRFAGIFDGELRIQPASLDYVTRNSTVLLKIARFNVGQFLIWNFTAVALAYGPDPLKYRMVSLPWIGETLSCYSWAIEAGTSAALVVQFLPTGA